MSGRSASGRSPSGRSPSGRGRRGGGRAYSSPRNASIGSSAGTSSTQAPSTQPSSSEQQNFEFLARGGHTGFHYPPPQQQQQPQQRFPPPQGDYDPILQEHGTGPAVDFHWGMDDLFDDIPETQEGDIDPDVSLETLLAHEGRAQRLPVLNPDHDAPPDTIWWGRDPGSWISRRLTKIIMKTFDGPYYSWKKYPQRHKEKLLHKFAQWYHWDYQLHNSAVENLVFRQARLRFNDMVYAVRRDRSQPTWITNPLWQTMTAYWDTEDAKARSAKYSANRLSDRGGLGVSKHVGGSKSFDQHETDMSIKEGRRVGISEVFRATHMKDGRFVDKRSEDVVKIYEETREQRLSQLDPELTSDGRTETPALTQQQEDEIFIQAASSVRPGPAYGIPKRRAVSADGSSSSRPSGWSAMAEEFASMKETNTKLQEEMRQIAEQRKEELRELAEQRKKDEAAMEQLRRLLAHPDMMRLAASLTTSPQPSDASQNGPPPQNDPPAQ